MQYPLPAILKRFASLLGSFAYKRKYRRATRRITISCPLGVTESAAVEASLSNGHSVADVNTVTFGLIKAYARAVYALLIASLVAF